MPKKASPPPTGIHGNADLPSVTVESYNVELRDTEGFVGDRASKGAFLALVEEVREQLKEVDDDPLGETPTDEIGRRRLDKLLATGEPEVAGLIQGAAEEFAQRLASVIRRFMRLKAVAGRGAHRGGRRLSREPHRRARHRPRLGDPEEPAHRRHARSDPPPSRRGGADRLHPARAALDVLRP